MKAMSDGDVNDFVFKKLMGDLDGIEAKGMFDEEKDKEEPPKDGANMSGGMKITIEPMNGQQTKEMPKIEAAPEEDDELGMLGL
jgi:hypothetical protein